MAIQVVTTRFGTVTLARLVLLVALAVVYRLGYRAEADERDGAVTATVAAERWQPPPAVPAAVVGFLLAAVMFTPGLAGHASVSPPVAVNLAVDGLHVLAAAAWLGGLVVLLVAAFPATAVMGEDGRARILAPVVGRLSVLALGSVTVLVLTGIVRSWVEVGALRALTTTAYGWVLLTKLGVVAVLLALGAANHFWARPRIQRAITDYPEGTSALVFLRRSVAAETALGVVVLAVTALLVNLAPARVSAGVTGPAVVNSSLGRQRLEVVVDPNRVGENLVHVTVTTASGAPAELEAVRVLFRMPTHDIGPIPADGVQLGPGHFVVQGRQLSVPGPWQLEIVAFVDRFTDLRTTVDVVVNR